MSLTGTASLYSPSLSCSKRAARPVSYLAAAFLPQQYHAQLLSPRLSPAESLAYNSPPSDDTAHHTILSSYFIGDEPFKATIEQIGGHVDNANIGKIDDVTIFNGCVWISVCNVYDCKDCDLWTQRLEQEFFKEGNQGGYIEQKVNELKTLTNAIFERNVASLNPRETVFPSRYH